MGTLTYATNMSLDGYIEDATGDFALYPHDDEVFAASTALIGEASTLLYGRRLYEAMAVWETDPSLGAQPGLFADFAAAWQDADPGAAALSSMAKLTAVDMLGRVTDKALQVHGGIGYWQSQPIERVYRDARAQRFEEGTNEIQKTVIARDLLRRAAALDLEP